jgi:serine/threonine protein kinase
VLHHSLGHVIIGAQIVSVAQSQCCYNRTLVPSYGSMLHCRVAGCTLYDAEQPNQQQGLAAQHALRALHNRGVLHGDLRPENIILTDADSGQNGVCLLDFASSSRSTAVDLQQAEELELAGLFSDKVCPLMKSRKSHHVCMMQHQPCAHLHTPLSFGHVPFLTLQGITLDPLTPPLRKVSLPGTREVQ